jgi:hypothetical protein
MKPWLFQDLPAERPILGTTQQGPPGWWKPFAPASFPQQ